MNANLTNSFQPTKHLILDKKMFVKTSQGFGFAPVLNQNGWALMMFSSQDNFNRNIPDRDFLIQELELSTWTDYWQIASYLKNEINLINGQVNDWMNPFSIKTITREEIQQRELSRFD